ncbi:hypothetical protein FKM82_027586 [Ascaphus truei]
MAISAVYGHFDHSARKHRAVFQADYKESYKQCIFLIRFFERGLAAIFFNVFVNRKKIHSLQKSMGREKTRVENSICIVQYGEEIFI